MIPPIARHIHKHTPAQTNTRTLNTAYTLYVSSTDADRKSRALLFFFSIDGNRLKGRVRYGGEEGWRGPLDLTILYLVRSISAIFLLTLPGSRFAPAALRALGCGDGSAINHYQTLAMNHKSSETFSIVTYYIQLDRTFPYCTASSAPPRATTYRICFIVQQEWNIPSGLFFFFRASF